MASDLYYKLQIDAQGRDTVKLEAIGRSWAALLSPTRFDGLLAREDDAIIAKRYSNNESLWKQAVSGESLSPRLSSLPKAPLARRKYCDLMMNDGFIIFQSKFIFFIGHCF